MDYEVGRGRLLRGRRRLLYRRNVHFSPMKKTIIGSGDSLIISRTDAEVYFMDADLYFKIEFGRRAAVKLHADVQKNPRLYSATACPTFMR